MLHGYRGEKSPLTLLLFEGDAMPIGPVVAGAASVGRGLPALLRLARLLRPAGVSLRQLGRSRAAMGAAKPVGRAAANPGFWANVKQGGTRAALGQQMVPMAVGSAPWLLLSMLSGGSGDAGEGAGDFDQLADLEQKALLTL